MAAHYDKLDLHLHIQSITSKDIQICTSATCVSFINGNLTQSLGENQRRVQQHSTCKHVAPHRRINFALS